MNKDGEEVVGALRVGFNHRSKGAGLLSFGHDRQHSDICLRDFSYDDHQADFDIDPESLHLVCWDYSTDNSTSLLFDHSCEQVGNWRAEGKNVVAQIIRPLNNQVLRVREARFIILWHLPAKEKEIQEAKGIFSKRQLSMHTPSTLEVSTQKPLGETYGKKPLKTEKKPLKTEKKPLKTEYPEQCCNYEPTLNLDLSRFPFDIRYMIFKQALVNGSVAISREWKKRVKENEGYDTVRNCVEILDLSHQLLNPGYSSRQLAMEAAEVFYRLNHFEIDIFFVRSFIWTLKHMPSLKPVDPLSTVSHLRLHINCGGMRANPFFYVPYWIELCIEADNRGHTWTDSTKKIAYRWTDKERKALIHGCTAITTNLSSLSDLEIHIRKERMCFGPIDLVADEPPPIHIVKNITPAIKKLRELGTKNVKVLLLGRRWDLENKPWSRSDDNDDTTEDITAWWDDPTEEDPKLACMENIEWLNSIAWHFHYDDEDWQRKGLIEGAIMRGRLLQAFKK